MNEQKVSEERLRELIKYWEPNGPCSDITIDTLQALNELLTLRQSASGEIEALEAGADALDVTSSRLRVEYYDRGFASDQPTKLETDATTLRHMAARMK